MSDDPAHAAPPAPPEVHLVGVSGFTPVFPKVGEPMTCYWAEANIGGEHPETYHARVIWKVDDQTIDDLLVDCTPLPTNGSINRTTDLSTPTTPGIGYSLELWIDVDHHTTVREGYNYAYHAVTVDD